MTANWDIPLSRSEYSLKSDLHFLIHHDGSWSVKNGVATFTSYPSGRTLSYDQESLEAAIQTVKSNRSEYRVYDAWRARLVQLQSGLSMLIAATKAGIIDSPYIFDTSLKEIE